ncbi:MAG: ABC transporter permease [Bacillota bacterium]
MSGVKASMKMYMEFTKKSFQRSAAYRFEAWMRLFSNVVFLLMWGFIWYGLYLNRESVSGVTFRAVFSYVLISQLLQGIHSAGTPLWEIQEKVRTGDIVSEIIRPYHYPIRLLFADFGSIAFYFFTAILPIYTILIVFLKPIIPASPIQWVLFLSSAMLGFLIRYCIELTFGLFTFWLVETGGVEDIYYFAISLFSGAMIPLWFFPDWLESLVRFLPFQGIYFIPNSIFAGQLAGKEIFSALGIQVFWLIISATILRLVWFRAVNKIVVQGG